MNQNPFQELTRAREFGQSQDTLKSQFLEVVIGGKAYKLKLGAEQDPYHLKKLSHFVDTKVSEFKKIFPISSHDTILMITLLNLAEQLLTKEAKQVGPATTESLAKAIRTSQPEQTSVSLPTEGKIGNKAKDNIAEFMEEKLSTLQTKLQAALSEGTGAAS